ncbi:RagB/SusD family nutrient uptake outer membrane protein [Flavobacterium sp. Sd200]|uniref:RagB/SusD family nutrient uptake outer membrane protein n=1 Tax=Flavobacterium sp. Sd200 TaxID=2692211 RepID=UPI00136E6C02|nr:RagB/SusD family nutrient uptake outer membrane protein [Flavobacterium sp. Sd200]MXN92605.1 RagB/SusD family nutrient uptake outer membrane protein [Flavobacterium sp. Sd200]
MKFKNILCFVALGLCLSCGDDFLDEVPVDFRSPENAYKTYGDFTLSVNNLYRLVRREFYSRDENYPMDYTYGTDLVFDGQASQRRWTPYINVMRPQGGAEVPATHWADLYKIITESNTIIARLQTVEFSTAEETRLEAEARFFRAFAYRTLVYLFGGVPLELNEVESPRFNYVRATKEEVLAQCILDAKFAADNLRGIMAVENGQVNNLAASHLLSEIYLANNQPQLAAEEATKVINDPNVRLMTARFGSQSTVNPGDVYWDLYRRNNQNRASGNTEGLWVIQFETDVLGGGAVSTGMGGAALYERHHAPMVRDYRLGGRALFKWPMSDYTGGRGIGWAISTRYFSNTIWESDWNNDIRNANHNFVREFVYNNPAFPEYYGTVVSTENPPAGITVPSRSFYAYQSKVTTPGDHPTGLYANLQTGELKATAGGTYTDQYMFRLAETYLLRAEAYFKAGNSAAAAADINVVRQRANANPVAAADVTIDYILDERMRELGIEEKRRLTLMRMGLLYDRVSRLNPYYSDILEINNLWPIPYSEIERNTEALLEQNPGYTN